MTIEVHVVATQMMGIIAADLVLGLLPSADPVLGVATGDTPLPLYAELAARASRGDIGLGGATLVALDEYVGLGREDPRSYWAYLLRHVATPLGVPADRLIVPDGRASPRTAARAFGHRLLAAGRVDVQIAGIGGNGHLGFNEPGSRPGSRTRAVRLSNRTRSDNAAHFGGHPERVPKRAITQGLSTLLDARALVVLARGAHKADAVAAALYGPVTRRVPASFLQTHPRAIVIADEAASGARAR